MSLLTLRLILVVLLIVVSGSVWPEPAMAAGKSGDQQKNQQQEEDKGPKRPPYFSVDSLNQGLPPLEKPPDLETPRAALVNFFLASRDANFERAARSLNFNAVPADERSPAPTAMRLYYVITQQVEVDFGKVPDRPDGAIEEVSEEESERHPLAGEPRRSIKIGTVPIQLGDVEIRLERFKTPDGDPIWLFSPRTVEKIDEMYHHHGPGPLFDRLPVQVRHGLLSSSRWWHWGLLLSLALLAAVSGWLIKQLLRFTLRRFAASDTRDDAVRLSSPLGVLTGLVTFYVVTYSLLSPPGDNVRALYPLVTILLVAAVTWVGIRLIDLVSVLAARRYRDKLESFADQEARFHYTRISVGRHALIFLAISVGLGLALYELQVIKNLSLSFLASAGVASVVLGVTAHTVLGNTLAGIQIALTQPVAIGDSISFEGHWGFVEEVTYAYVGIRTWDQRRLIVPLSYFISHPFENWSKANARNIKPIYLYADYHVDVDAVRTKFRELLERSEGWDRTVEPVLQVTGMTEKTVELRALCSAKDPSTAWDLHCQLREELIAFLQRLEGGRFLPRERLEWSDQRASLEVADSRHGR